jgi:hypothetical protein
MMYQQLEFMLTYAARRINSAFQWTLMSCTILAFATITATAKAASSATATATATATKPEDYAGGGIRWDWAKIFVDAIDYYAGNFRGLALAAGAGLAAVAVAIFVFVSRSDHRSSEALTWVARIIVGIAGLIILPVILKIVITGADKVHLG